MKPCHKITICWCPGISKIAYASQMIFPVNVRVFVVCFSLVFSVCCFEVLDGSSLVCLNEKGIIFSNSEETLSLVCTPWSGPYITLEVSSYSGENHTRLRLGISKLELITINDSLGLLAGTRVTHGTVLLFKYCHHQPVLYPGHIKSQGIHVTSLKDLLSIKKTQ